MNAEPNTESGTALRADLAAAIERDLLLRFARVTLLDQEMIECTAELAACVAWLGASIWNHGAAERGARLHTSMTASLQFGLWRLGANRIAGCDAERILANALAMQKALLALTPPAGSA
jgi:hypothetical protein